MTDTEFAVSSLTPPPEALGTPAAVEGLCLSFPACRCSLACGECGPLRLDEAEALYRALVEEEPNDFYAWLNLGVVERRRGRTARALVHFERALVLKPRPKLVRDAGYSCVNPQGAPRPISKVNLGP